MPMEETEARSMINYGKESFQVSDFVPREVHGFDVPQDCS
jgi:hypothetical protein